MVLDIFCEEDSLENCRAGILDKFSENFRFFHVINYLLTGLLVPYREILEILSPQFLRKLGPALPNSGISTLPHPANK